MTQLTDPARIQSFVEMIDKSINKTMNWTQYEPQYVGTVIHISKTLKN